MILFGSYFLRSNKSMKLNLMPLKMSNESFKVLVIYVFANTHSLSLANLQYFIRVAVMKSTNVNYYIILQQFNNLTSIKSSLPSLPSYAHYIEHENKCFDLGTIGWFLSNGTINKDQYKYFIFLNSSVRGPYLVSYYQLKEWYSVFTNRLNNYIKLVGPTISCQVSPHVQSYFWATDQQGLSTLLKNGKIFTCHETQVNAIYNGEIPASRVLFDAGFSIDSLMKKYEGFDFRKDRNDDCYRMENPLMEKMVDGVSLDPFEIVFAKFKTSTREFLHIQSRIPAYDKWILNNKVG
jgi:hypothetical protein